MFAPFSLDELESTPCGEQLCVCESVRTSISLNWPLEELHLLVGPLLVTATANRQPFYYCSHDSL